MRSTEVLFSASTWKVLAAIRGEATGDNPVFQSRMAVLSISSQVYRMVKLAARGQGYRSTCQRISKLVFTILSAVAESERDRIRERIRDVKRNLAAQGVYNGGKRPFGSNIENGRLVPNAAEQAVLARIHSMRAAGAGYREIGRAVGKEATTVKRIVERARA